MNPEDQTPRMRRPLGPVCAVLLEPTPDGWRISYTRRVAGTPDHATDTATAPNFDRAVGAVRARLALDGWQTCPVSPPGRP